MAFVEFNDSGYEYFDQGYFVLFSENNTHNLLFEYAAKDLSGLPELFSKYVATRLDGELALVGDGQGKEVIEQIIEVLKSAHRYYEHEYRKTILNEIGNYFNELVIFLCYNCRTLNPELAINEEWYIERLEWLMYPLLEAGDTYPVDFYNEYKNWIGSNCYIPTGADEDYETFVCNVPKRWPVGFGKEIRTQKTVCDMLYFILDIKAQDVCNLTKPQRIWLFANLFPDGYSEMNTTRKLSFCSKPRFRKEDNRSQEIEDSQILENIFSQLHSIDSRTISKMKKETKYCFKLAVKTAEDIQTASIFSEYEIYSLWQLLYLEVFYMIQKGAMIRRCKNCGKYFVVTNRKIVYCNRIDKVTGERCSDIGSKAAYKNKLNEDNVLKVYNRAYKTHFARYKNNIITKDKLDNWRIEAKKKLEQVREGELDIAAFQTWLKK